MAKTYNAADLGATTDAGTIARVRLDLGIADPPSVLDDAEILHFIASLGRREGTARCAEACIAQVSQDPDTYKDDGGVEVRWSERTRAWREFAARIRATGLDEAAPTEQAVPMAGAITVPGMDGLTL